MNWLKRARCEISKVAIPGTAKTDERNSATAAVPPKGGRSIGSNGSTLFRGSEESEALRHDYEERAAIMEFDGGLSREQAEGAAGAFVFKIRHLLN